jgi:hypothetical protein
MEMRLGTTGHYKLRDHVQEKNSQFWPTPSTRDYKGQNSAKHLAKARGHHDQLPNALALQGHVGQLNPTWVAWLMGYPTEWLNCVDSEMPSSRKSRLKSSDASTK